MSRVGSYLVIIGLLAVVTGFIGRVPNLFAWIYNWGEVVAWVIKLSLIIIGGIIFYFGRETDINQDEK